MRARGGGEVAREGFLHRIGRRSVAGEGEVILSGGGSDELVDGGKRVGWCDVDGWEGLGEVGIIVESGKIEEEEDKTVLAAVIGEGKVL